MRPTSMVCRTATYALSTDVIRLASALRYARDVAEVLFVKRLVGSPGEKEEARDVATLVRRARFHAHAKIPSLGLSDIVSRLGTGPVTDVRLAGPRDLSGVGSPTYYHALASLVRALRPASVLEIGTYLGVGTLTIALNSPQRCRIVTVDLPDDPFVPDGHGLSQGDRELIARRRARVGEAFINADSAMNITQIRVDSLGWRPDDSLVSMDLVLIDGGHSYPVVRADTVNAFKLLAPAE